MITVSSNLATNLLMDKLGVDNIRAGVRSLGASGMNVRRDLEDGKAFAAGLNNTTTARALQQLMAAIAHGEAVDAESSREMLAILERQTVNDRIPAGLPAGTRVAHKTGEITGIRHDAAIVFAPRPFVLVVLTRGAATPEQGSELIAAITRELYRATQ
jgi:beta-lactamase class A